MPKAIKIHTPLNQAICASLQAGDRVLISGKIFAARDAAHKKMIEALARGEALPLNLQDQIIYYVGPTPARPGMAVGSAGPTTAGRMDKYTPALLALGLLGIIAKGDRSNGVIQSLQAHGAVYFAATGGAGALLARCIKSYTVLAYPELGPEALAALEVVDFPAIVAIDSAGNNLYRSGPEEFCQLPSNFELDNLELDNSEFGNFGLDNSKSNNLESSSAKPGNSQPNSLEPNGLKSNGLKPDGCEPGQCLKRSLNQ